MSPAHEGARERQSHILHRTTRPSPAQKGLQKRCCSRRGDRCPPAHFIDRFHGSQKSDPLLPHARTRARPKYFRTSYFCPARAKCAAHAHAQPNYAKAITRLLISAARNYPPAGLCMPLHALRGCCFFAAASAALQLRRYRGGPTTTRYARVITNLYGEVRVFFFFGSFSRADCEKLQG